VPVYDYVCSNCHRLTEVVHGIAADGPRYCPECGAEGTMTKVISAPSVHFKGSGWAKKDRSSSSRAAARSSEASDTSESSGAGEAATAGSASASTDEAGKSGGTSAKTDAATADKGASTKKADGAGSTKAGHAGSGSAD
jgi:putative FmdB family regulatory protein